MKMTKDYTKQINISKFIFTVMMAFTVFVLILAYLDIDLKSVCKFDCIYIVQNLWIFSLGFILLLPILYTKQNTNKYIHIPTTILILSALNLTLRPEVVGLDFLLTGPRPTTIYLYVIGVLWYIVVYIKNRK